MDGKLLERNYNGKGREKVALSWRYSIAERTYRVFMTTVCEYEIPLLFPNPIEIIQRLLLVFRHLW